MSANVIYLLFFLQALLCSVSAASNATVPINCRYALNFTMQDILNDYEPFKQAYLQRESRFHTTPNVSFNPDTGMGYDTREILLDTGLLNTSTAHYNGATSKEAQQLAMYALALSGNQDAKTFVYADNTSYAEEYIMDVLNLKLKTYATFNQTYPGFGGLFPWYRNTAPLMPDYPYWTDKIPALDNGEMIWSIYALVSVMENSTRSDFLDMAAKWQTWLDYYAQTAPAIFYFGSGNVCTVTNLNQNISWADPANNKSCPVVATIGQPAYLNDPYEGELFTWFLYLYTNLSDTDKEALWEVKRPQLVRVEYNGSVVNVSASDNALVNYTGAAVVHPFNKTITAQQGFWFSAHENWKILEMPYLDVPLIKSLFANAERIRTCDAQLIGNPGMFASTDNLTATSSPDHQFGGYVSAAGVPSLATQNTQELDLITPYAVMNLQLFNQTVAMAWLHNMLLAKGSQGPLGVTEAIRRDGSAIANLVGWDSRVTTILGMLGGIGPLVRTKLQREGKYDTFISKLTYEYQLKFNDTLLGEDVEFCLPNVQVPDGGAKDFTTC